ncbi:MAG: F0F1 ATP synthase subunit delta [Candidatus Omnitrophica bacterium]|nr:F0F1 ATP synthase subunit delta [Candidatus Omnitrophota bacterium]
MLIIFIIINLATFLAMVLVFRKVMISSSYDETRRLQQQNLENSRKAVELEQKIEEAEKHYKEKLVRAEEEIKKLKERAVKEAEVLKEQIVSKAKGERDRLIEQAINAREKLREDIEAGLVEKSLELSRRIVTEIFNSEHQKLVYDAFLKEVFEAMEKMDLGTLKGVIPARSNAGITQCRVQSSHALDPHQREKLIKILSERAGEKVSLEEVTDKGLIAGIIVQIGSFRIDGSLAAKFRKAAENIRHGG